MATLFEKHYRAAQEAEGRLFMRFEYPVIMEQYWQDEWYDGGRNDAYWGTPAVRENVPERYRASYQSGYADGMEEVRAAPSR
jgi:hypothetical protein